MGMIFCHGCRHQIHDSAVSCPKCGAPNAVTGSSRSSSTSVEMPDSIKGWSWGAFLLNWIWAIGNRTWIGLLALIPYVGFIMVIILGIKGREWAWKNKQWDSVEHFNEVQRKWSIWGGIITGVVFVVGLMAAIAIPAYQDYKSRAEEISFDQTAEESINQNDVQQGNNTQTDTLNSSENNQELSSPEAIISNDLATVSDQNKWWDNIKNNPNVFIDECMLPHINAKGINVDVNLEKEREYCISQLTEMNQCMSEKANVNACQYEVMNRGD